MKVSVVTISFNQCSFLERAIQSVLNQDYHDVEYIIEDPGSKDGSLELIRKYETRLARTILEPDKGPSDGLNKGFAAATGDIFGFLNSDDILYPGAISAVVRYFQDHPDVDVVSGHAKIIGPRDEVLRLCYSDRMSVRRFAYASVVLMQPSTFFRRRAFELTKGFNPMNRVNWDGELFFDMARAGCKFGKSSAIWSGYRLHGESITSTCSADLEKHIEEVRKEMFCKMMGRTPNRRDKCLFLTYRIYKHVLNPRDTLERILRGPVFRRTLN